MQPLVIDYLKTHTFQQLEDEHGVCARPSSSGIKFSLNYDQILSKGGDVLAGQCRGIVIAVRQPELRAGADDSSWKNEIVGEVDVLARPMDRFYNFGDTNVSEIDWSDPDLRAYEKVDGTCIIVYWDPTQERWHCATRSVPEADLPIRAGDLEIGDTTFSQLFLRALVATREEISGVPVDWPVDGPDKVVHLNKEVTYVFELVSRHNQIVVDYPDPRVYLLAARHVLTGLEIPIEKIRMQHVRRPRTWPLKDAVSIGAFVNSCKPSELEGIVVCDSAFRRAKIKSVAYVIAHRSKDAVTSSPRNAMEAIILEKIDDVVPLVPANVGERMIVMRDAYAAFCKRIDTTFKEFKERAAGDRKAFALLVTSSGEWTPPYFNLWEGRATGSHQWIKSAREKGKISDGTLDTIIARLEV